jgi:GNAT superfamily N-acetyltransferase
VDFRPASPGAAALSEYAALMGACFPGTDKFTGRYLDWLYARNPDGTVVGFDAFDGDEIAAHYACVPATASIAGRPARVLLSLNTATHPRHQGRGLFTRLASMTYERAAQQGFSAVYGVANANSTPGFVRKLGFQSVRALDAQIGVGALGIDAEALRGAAFRRTWSPASASWRGASPAGRVSARVAGGVLQCHASALGPFISACAEYPLGEAPQFEQDGRAPSPLRLHLGLRPAAARGTNAYVAIPRRLRPSPLNLIYLSLDGRHRELDPRNVSFGFLDFDAY